MLSLRYPKLRSELKLASIGLWPIRLPDDPTPAVLMKLPKQYILTAVERRFLKLYFVPLEIRGVRLLGLTTAFFDDGGDPLVVRTLLFEDEISSVLLAALLEPRLHLHLFDDHGRELAGFVCEVTGSTDLREDIESFGRSVPDLDVMADAYETVIQWFSHRSDEDDRSAFYVDLREELIPSDLLTIDLDEDLAGFAGAPLVAHHTLVQEEPGPYQERDIVRTLQRIFPNDQLAMNPMRADKPGNEFADALIVTSTHVIIVQAKDSPNTPATLNRSLERKRINGRGQLADAAKQLQGAINHCRRADVLRVLVDGAGHEFEVAGKKIVGLMVVRELFPDETDHHLQAIAQVRTKTGADAVLLDYAGLAVATFHSSDAESFLDAMDGLSGEAKEGRYPDVTTYFLQRHVSGLGRLSQQESDDGPDFGKD